MKILVTENKVKKERKEKKHEGCYTLESVYVKNTGQRKSMGKWGACVKQRETTQATGSHGSIRHMISTKQNLTNLFLCDLCDRTASCLWQDLHSGSVHQIINRTEMAASHPTMYTPTMPSLVQWSGQDKALHTYICTDKLHTFLPLGNNKATTIHTILTNSCDVLQMRLF